MGRKIKKTLNAAWAIPAVLLIRILKPFVHIRVGLLRADRMGHYPQDTAEWCARLQMSETNIIELFWSENYSNLQWKKMVDRSPLRVYDCLKYVAFWNKKIPGGRNHSRLGSLTKSRDIEGLYQQYDVKIPFLDQENDKAKKWLMSQGWTEGEPFVCLLVRDDAYLNQCSLHKNNNDWSYHNYRNSDLDTYIKATEWLAGQGVWVLRMGKMVQKPFKTKHPRIIDYAFNNQKSDLLDVWLFANCSAVISTGTGIDAVSEVYGVPIIFVNILPLRYIHSYSYSTWVSKRLYWRANNKALTLIESIKYSFLHSSQYDDYGIEIVDLSENEILASVKEFWSRINGEYHETEKVKALQNKFWKTLKSYPGFSEFQGTIHSKCSVDSTWLLSQDDDFFNGDFKKTTVKKVEECLY